MKLPTFLLAPLTTFLLFSCNSVDPDLPFIPTAQEDIVSPEAKLKILWKDGSFTEGPTVDRKGAVLFTDIRTNRIMKYDPDTGMTLNYRTGSGSANGLKMVNGKLYACEGADGGGRRVSVSDSSGKVSVVTDKYMGKKFNSPNDVAVTSTGDIYFTDPRYKARPEEKRELDFEGVFLVRKGKTVLATRETERPNGILISKDGKTAFIADNNNTPGGARELLKFNISEDGTFTEKEVLFRFKDSQRGMDGMAMDNEGNIYATAGKGAESGIYVFSPAGIHLAFIELPDMPTNCTFGGSAAPNTLYITCQVKRQPDDNKKFGLFKIKLLKQGN